MQTKVDQAEYGVAAAAKNVLGGEVTLANYQHPEWDSDPEVNN